MRAFFTLLRWARRSLTLLVILGLLAFNIATLTIPAVAVVATAAVEAVGLSAAVVSRAGAAKARAASRAATRAAVRRSTAAVKRRVSRAAARNVGAVAAESLPYVGAAAVVTFTALELHDACKVMEEMRVLERAVDLDAEEGGPAAGEDRTAAAEADAEVREVCGLRAPSKEELAETMKAAPAGIWAKAAEMADGALPEVDPDWDAYRQRVLDLTSLAFWKALFAP